MEGEAVHIQVRSSAPSKPKQCIFDPEAPYVRVQKTTSSLYVTNMPYNPVPALLK